jgi:hypothetical protein
MAKFGTLEYVLAESLKDATILERDRSIAALARQYARLIDDAAPVARYADPLRVLTAAVAVLGSLGVDTSKAGDALRKITIALGEHSVASDLGPKLLAALTALGMTPASRGTGGGAGGPVVVDELAKLRERSRERRAGVHGA